MHQSLSIQWEDAARVIEPQVTPSGIHVCDFNPSFPMEVRYLHLRAPSSITMRRHDYYEVLYLQSGSAIWRIENREMRVNQGDLFIMGGDLRHGIQSYLTPTVQAVVLYFDPQLIVGNGAAPEDADYLSPFEFQGHDFPHMIPASTGIPLQVLDLIERTHRERTAGTAYAQLAMKTYLKMILVSLRNHYTANLAAPVPVLPRRHELERLQPLLDYVDQHYIENISVEQAAGVLHMSKSHFMRFFRAVTGQAFVTHLNRFRIARTQHLIATTNLSITAICHQAGFCDQSYFGVVFRRFVGMSPREYRDSLRVVRAS